MSYSGSKLEKQPNFHMAFITFTTYMTFVFRLHFAQKVDFGLTYSPFWGFSTKTLLL